MRRSHDKVKAKNTSPCPQCGTNIPSHVVCPTCGYYMGRIVNPPKDEE
ncbi:MAG: 50S ribosomal protein L32 [Pirellulaceae bacterium]|nr:50S ribosomal protein L32 [Pirellulaceae bacterium]